uniref:Uncharacterized protein LOC104244477 n=1 Tax=Nicotiana sylvestris TaxID=4096 RepID=A0A1U7YHA4_NICSY|nr:PREDICTED: uncharacterized protein LOC104244477 [Nicotiana sylvestris]
MTMRSVTLEVPANHSLLRKTGRADVWLEPLIGDIEKKKMESHSCLTLMNDVVHSTLKANLIGTELMGRISLLERRARESEKTIHEAEEIARGAQLEATNWKEQFENAQGTIEELASEEVRELKTLLARKEEYAGELVQSLTQAQADLQTSSDEIHALKTEYQILKNDLAMWEKEYGLLEENFNIEVSWAFLKSRRDALTEAAQEGFDLQSELAKVIDTIEKSQQSTDTPSPALEVPGTEELLNEEVNTAAIGITIPASAENVAIPASEGETSMTQSVEVEASVTLVSLIDPNISSSAETVHVAASSEVLELCQVLSPNPSFPVQLKFDLFYLQLFPSIRRTGTGINMQGRGRGRDGAHTTTRATLVEPTVAPAEEQSSGGFGPDFDHVHELGLGDYDPNYTRYLTCWGRFLDFRCSYSRAASSGSSNTGGITSLASCCCSVREREKFRRFINGLNYGLRYNLAREAETNARLENEEREAKRPHGPGDFSSSSSGGQSHYNRGRPFRPAQTARYVPHVSLVSHSSYSDHPILSSFSVLQAQSSGQARCYVFLAGIEAVASNAAITGIVSVCHRVSSVFFDPGSIYSYVSSYFARYLNMSRDSLVMLVYVFTPGDSIMVDRVYRSCVVSFGGCETRLDLLLLSMVDFDVILDMD